MSKDKIKSLFNYRWRNWGLFILVTLSMVQGISLAGSADFNKLTDVPNSNPVTELEELYPTEYQNQPEIIIDEITEEEYSTAEIAISIGYNLTSGLEVTVGVEEAPIGQIGESGANESLSSLTGLSSVAFRRTSQLWNDSKQDPYITKNQQVTRKTGGIFNLTTISALIQDLGFSKDDLLIKTNSRHWFVEIKDKNDIKPYPSNASEEYSRPVGWLESFNITIGDIRFSSLLHPLFAAGWEVAAHISGRACEIFYKTTVSQSTAGGGASIAYHWHWVNGTKLYGVAGVVGIGYFEYWKDRSWAVTETAHLLETLEGIGIWEIYYMVTNGESDHIDDSDVIWLLGTLVNDAIGTPASVDHCFWFINTHGYYGFWPPHPGYLVTSGTFLDDDAIYRNTLGNLIDDITSKGVWLFYWLANCYGNHFDTLWTNSAIHHNRVLYWYYTGKSYNKIYCLDAFKRHIAYGQKSLQWMFVNKTDETDEYHMYKNPYNGLESPYFDDPVKFTKVAYESQGHPDTMFQEDTMWARDDYEFCLVPNTDGWIPSCRTRGEPSDEVNEPSRWDSSVLPYMFSAYESSPGTFRRYVGFYIQVYVGGVDNEIHIDFDGRAESDTSGSSVTNLRVSIYSEDWQTRVGEPWAVFSGGLTDSGWLDDSDHTFTSIPKEEYYNIFIYYSDGWSRCWFQEIHVKNIYIGNAQKV